MCIGIPLQVLAAEGHEAICVARDGHRERVDTALVGGCVPGEWLLVFLGSARERVDAVRANEVLDTLELLQRACEGGDAAHALAPFALPSSLDAPSLAALTGAADVGRDPSPRN